MAQRHKLSKHCWKTDANQLSQRRVASNLQSAKNTCLQSSVNQRAIKLGLPVIPQTLEGELEKLLGKNVEPNEDQTLKECLTRLKKRMIIYIYIYSRIYRHLGKLGISILKRLLTKQEQLSTLVSKQ